MKSWIKIGCLPSLNLPTKLAPVPFPKREIPETVSSFPSQYLPDVYVNKTCKYSSLNDVISDFHILNPANWRFYQSKNTVHLTYFDDPKQHAIARVSLLITQDEDKVVFDVALSGVYCVDISNHLSEDNLDLAAMLRYLLKFQSCSGYKYVEDESSWLHTTVMCSPSSQIRR